MKSSVHFSSVHFRHQSACRDHALMLVLRRAHERAVERINELEKQLSESLQREEMWASGK